MATPDSNVTGNRSRQLWLFVISFTVVLAVLVAMLVGERMRAYDEQLNFSRRNCETLVRVLEEHALASVTKIDLQLQAIATQQEMQPNLSREQLDKLLATRLAAVPEAQSLRIVNIEGKVVADASGSLPPGKLDTRPYFLRHRTDAAAGLVISEPSNARTGNNWGVTLSRRINDDHGGFTGLVQATIKTDYFESFYSTLNVGTRGYVALRDDQQRLIARFPSRPELLGDALPRKPHLRMIRLGKNEGTFLGVNDNDGIERMTTFRRVGSLPLEVSVGMSIDDILTEWRTTAYIYGIVAVILIGMSLFLLNNWRRQHARALDLAKDMTAANHEISLRSQALLDSLPDVAWLNSKDDQLIAVNEMFARMSGWPKDQIIGRSGRGAWPRELAEHLYQLEDSALKSGRPARLDARVRFADDVERYTEIICTPALDASGKVIGSAGVVRDITERKAAEDLIRYLAEHDYLTTLPNRASLNEYLTHAILTAGDKRVLVAVLFVDLDHFKNINDTLGHEIGDQILKTLAERLRSVVHETDMVSRQGGDEFVVMLVDCENTTEIAHVAERVLAAVAQPCEVAGHELAVTASIGISICPQDGTDISALLRNADVAMYHAKSQGRNNFQFFEHDMNARVFERLTTENNLRKALKRKEFVLHFQPQVTLATGKATGAEALIRWRLPDGNLVSPARFIPVSEESRLIVPIGEWVLFEACRQNKAWQAAGLPPIVVHVNLSAVQFQQADIVDTVARALAMTGLEPQWLGLEITESVMMHNLDQVLEKLNQLKLLGVSLSIDDFGTGYSSLSYLKRFPIDKIKIDQSFVRDIMTDADDAAITRAIISLAGNLHHHVVAEGVETQEQLEFLRQYGCEEIQGDYFSKPVPAVDLAAYLRKYG